MAMTVIELNPPTQTVEPATGHTSPTYDEMLAIQAAAPVAINYDDMARYYFPYPSERYTYTDKGCDEVQYGHDLKPYNPTGRQLYPYRCGYKESYLFGGPGLDIGMGIAAGAAAFLLFSMFRR